MSIFIFYSLFVILAFLSFFLSNNKTAILVQKKWLPLISVVLIVVATFRPETMRDYATYTDSFFSTNEFLRYEPAYVFLVQLIKGFTSEVKFLFLIMSTISITLNIIAIKKWANFIILSILVYLSNLFIIHDMIQIRCAVSCALFLFAIPYIYQRNFLKFIFIIFICTLFHYSSIVLVFFYFLNSSNINTYFYYSLIPLSYLLCFLNSRLGTFISIIPIDFVQEAWNMYSNAMDNDIGTKINLFNIFIILRIIICYFLLFYSKSIKLYNNYFIIWIKIYTFSICAFLILSDVPVLSFRISELFQCVEFLLLPMLMYIPIRNGYVLKKISVIWIGLIFLFINAFYNQFLS